MRAARARASFAVCADHDLPAQRLRQQRLAEPLALLREQPHQRDDVLGRRGRRDQPGVAEPGGSQDAGLSHGADPERRARLLHGLEVDGGVAELPEATVEGHGVLRPERLEQRDAFLEARNALVERDAERLELLRHVAGAEADHEAPAADDVEGRELLGQDDGVVERRQHHRGRELDLRIELPREPGEERDGLQPPRAREEEVLADHHVRQAGPLGGLDLTEHGAQVLAHRHTGREVAEDDPRLHRAKHDNMSMFNMFSRKRSLPHAGRTPDRPRHLRLDGLGG